MRYFWPIYLTAFVAGTVIVFMAAPLARPYVPEWMKVSTPSATTNVVRPVAAARIQSSGRTASANSTAAGQASTAIQEMHPDELPPALHGIYLAQRSERPGWGITHQRAAYYTPDGSRVGHVEGGVLFDFQGVRTSSKGSMVECILHEDNIPATPMLISASDAFLFTGDHKKLSQRQRNDLKAYYTLTGKIAGRRKEILQQAADKNPFFSEYQAAYKTLMTHVEKAKQLSRKRDKATDQEKIQIEDTLRQMKTTEAQLRKTYDAIHLKFRTWKEQHADEIPKPEDDAQIQQWTQQRLALIPRVPGLAY
ncbi:MAG: hypothetical protein KBI41_01860 [Kiritimatiellae bacterium]|jgi:hypothetical protein|nr:hypothetical protein [Kiritimatiellia bacterium]MDD2347824.1 hypothetical protein [Kiritimatiellia bacterium]MDD3585136.1 hypothetical protein [Kiritimatiellia bacterium]HHU16481.1 hypothetical protein [Lentisphaerota bacterium]HON46577.1 hypothetical protein [Kiritimatiellia bacterium]